MMKRSIDQGLIYNESFTSTRRYNRRKKEKKKKIHIEKEKKKIYIKIVYNKISRKERGYPLRF